MQCITPELGKDMRKVLKLWIYFVDNIRFYFCCLGFAESSEHEDAVSICEKDNGLLDNSEYEGFPRNNNGTIDSEIHNGGNLTEDWWL